MIVLLIILALVLMLGIYLSYLEYLYNKCEEGIECKNN